MIDKITVGQARSKIIIKLETIINKSFSVSDDMYCYCPEPTDDNGHPIQGATAECDVCQRDLYLIRLEGFIDDILSRIESPDSKACEEIMEYCRNIVLCRFSGGKINHPSLEYTVMGIAQHMTDIIRKHREADDVGD